MDKSLRTFTAAFLAIILYFLPICAFADFEVEVIVFLNNGDDKSEETPMKMKALPRFSNASSITSNEFPEGYTQLSNESLKLKKQYNRLEKSGRYTPVIHLAWRQPDVRENQRELLQISAPTTNGISIDGTLSVYRTPQDLIIEGNVFAIQQVAGFAPQAAVDPTVSGSAEDDVETLFENSGALDIDQTTNGLWQAWRTKEKRDVSSLSRIQYFDNPAFGILVRLRKIADRVELDTSVNSSTE